MNFPPLVELNDILPYIEDKENFTVTRKDDYVVVNYILNTPEYFNNAYEKECRGLIFNREGRIMSRPFHKFFNLNERPETSIDSLDLSEKHWILEKLDGSFMRPISSGGKIRWASKAGLTFVTEQVEKFIDRVGNQKYNLMARECLMRHFTPIFEWCSNSNRIVISHPIDRLVLLAIRSNYTGEYVDYEQMVDLANDFDIEVVKQYAGTVQNMQHLSDSIKDMKGLEGFVVRFADGRMVKIKADEYVLHHKAKDDLNLEKNIISILVNDQADDFSTLLSEDDKKIFKLFEHDFWEEMGGVAHYLTKAVNGYRAEGLTKKQFALEKSKDHDSVFHYIFFKYLENDIVLNIFEDMKERIKSKCGSQKNIDSVRDMFAVNWEDYKKGNPFE